MNILDVQDSLKDLPDNALMREMQMPSGTAPQFLVLSELKRRKRMREDFKRREAQDMKTVAEEAVTAAGMPQQGIMQMSRAMAPNTNVAQNTGMDTAMPVQPTQAPQPVQRMFDGGYIPRSSGFGENIEYNYDTFLQEMGLSDTPDARDMFRRYQDRMNTEYALEGPKSDPSLFMERGFNVAPSQGVASISADVSDFTAPSIDADVVTPSSSMPLDVSSLSAGIPSVSRESRTPEMFREDELSLAMSQGMPSEYTPPVSEARFPPEMDTGDLLEIPEGGVEELLPDPMAALSRKSADEAALLRREQGIVDARESIGAGILEDDQEKIDRVLANVRETRAEDTVMAQPVVGIDTGTPLDVEEVGIDDLLPPPSSDDGGARGGGGAGGGGAGAGGGFGSLDSRIASMLEAREKQAESDKWMALAQTGLALMSSEQPTLGGAIGEAGLAGLGALQESRRGAQDFETDMLKLQGELDLNRARIAAANRSGRGRATAGLTPANLISLINNHTDEKTRITNAIVTAQGAADPATGEAPNVELLERALIDNELKIRDYQRQLNRLGGSAGVSSGSDFDATAS